jgi:hypothetical protein
VSALDDAVQRDLWSTPLPTPVEELRKRARRRRARHFTAGLVAATLSVVAIASVVTEATSDRHHVVAVTGTPPDNGDVHAATSNTPITFAPTAPAQVDSAAPEPTQFFAAIGAGGERIALVDTATGKRGPFLTSPDQTLVRFSNDHKTIYVPSLAHKVRPTPTLVSCGSAWTAINVATGASRPAYTDLGFPNDVVESPDGKKIAYVRPLLQTSAKGCQSEELVVRDTVSGQERRWSAPRTSGGQTVLQTITQLGWSPDSAHLTYSFNSMTQTTGSVTSTWMLDINHGTSLTDGLQLRSPSTGCTIHVARFRPGTNLVVAAENCLGSSAKLVSFNARTGAITQITEVASGPIFGIIDLAFDASGRHLLYVLDGTSAQPSEVYVLRNGISVPLLADAYQVSW